MSLLEKRYNFQNHPSILLRLEGVTVKAVSTVYFNEEQTKKIEGLGYGLIMKDENLNNSGSINDAEILICYNPFDTLDISKMRRLKLIQLTSIGIDQVPLDWIIEKGIILTNNKGGYSIPMGEWIVLKMLEIYKNSREFYIQRQNKKWEMRKDVYELCSKKILFIGTGSIAKEAAKRLSGFQTTIWGINTTARKIHYFDECYKMDDLNLVVQKADVVVITIPYTNETHHIINDKVLGLMKEDAVFINVSRGSIVDEMALVNHLNRGYFMGVALDVFEEEPLPVNSELWDFDRVLISPHNSWMSEMRNERRFNIVYENMKRYIKNIELLNIVDLNKGY